MRVVATEQFKTYYGMVCIDVAEGEEFDGAFAEFLASGGAPVRVLDDASVPGAGDESDGPASVAGEGLDVDGTAAGVLAWVGEDPARAAQALEAEQAKEKPRSTLVKQLAKLAEQ